MIADHIDAYAPGEVTLRAPSVGLATSGEEELTGPG